MAGCWPGKPVKITRGTVDRWLKLWREGGFDALLPPTRQVTPRMPEEVLGLATGSPGPSGRGRLEPFSKPMTLKRSLDRLAGGCGGADSASFVSPADWEFNSCRT
ncbi:helix-turn-helix domain containing protein [Streptomyces sp. NBC_01017]|uniref:helix-turn-helix domain-containing protein n=1 Tax=Streptomyces sp. NBC_01017 TaxID=2903721 RepID=UPI0038679A4C|nr:helix-turn-helix domain containing protein [Streptomyces sp. NBC_01017]WSV35986.1 helix-turn-helix domain containing protein [Streptomyces sp. NBC_01017]